MTVEHERQCERTIASVVHEIDDLKRQLRETSVEIERLTALRPDERATSGEVHCGLRGRRMDFPNAGYAWTSDGTYHVFCYENPHLYQDGVSIADLHKGLTA